MSAPEELNADIEESIADDEPVAAISPRIDAAVASGAKDLRIGLMGGTFDPIHYGHLIAAEQAREQFGLDFVIFLPAGNPSFKQDKKISDGEDRYEMARIATQDNRAFDVSRIEIDREGVTYTYDTICELRDKLPGTTEVYFITGADAIVSLPKWYKADELAKIAHFAACTRPGYDYTQFKEAQDADVGLQFEVEFFDVPALEISSTDLRKRVSEGKSIAYMTPPQVIRFIAKRGLYMDGNV
ncbi:MAG: nicotinate-nucleotide adenylyltransferase [Coriobacteriales bacterium]|nr:nicotinate-nucleotide adenylyltransferase [Coriobacteriales bacterium]